ncbi:MAG: hypothetical protein AAGF97_04505 [Planctomycetota bacterium]
MCDSLRTLTEFVRENPRYASVGDVTRIACTACDTQATCAYVDSREFEARHPTDSRPGTRPTERQTS